jgi:hypothetical protein
MGALIQRLRHAVFHGPFFSFLRDREPVSEPKKAPERGSIPA